MSSRSPLNLQVLLPLLGGGLLFLGFALGWGMRPLLEKPRDLMELEHPRSTKAGAAPEASATPAAPSAAAPKKEFFPVAQGKSAVSKLTREESHEIIRSLTEKLEKGERLDSNELRNHLRMIMQAGEPGKLALTDFLMENVDFPLSEHQTEDTTNSLRFRIIQELSERWNRSKQSETAMAYILENSPAYVEVLEVSLALKNWGKTEYQSASEAKLRAMTQEQLSHLPADDNLKDEALGRCLAASMIFGSKDQLPGIVSELAKLSRPRDWSRAVSTMPGELQQEVFAQLGPSSSLATDPKIHLFDLTRRDLGFPAPREAAFNTYKNGMTEAQRVDYLQESWVTQVTTYELSVNGGGGSGNMGEYRSSEQKEAYLRRMQGLSQMLNDIETQVKSTPLEALMLTKRKAEVDAILREAPNWPIKPAKGR